MIPWAPLGASLMGIDPAHGHYRCWREEAPVRQVRVEFQALQLNPSLALLALLLEN